MVEIQYVLSLATAVVEQLFFTGLIFGWTSISYVLTSEGYLSYLCDYNVSISAENGTKLSNSLEISTNITTPLYTVEPDAFPHCKAQDEAIFRIFIIASTALSFSTILNGYIFDRFGTWISRMFAILLITGGSVLVSVSTVETSALLYPAMCCFSVGGILLLVTNMQLGNLFGKARSSVITLLNGALDSSSVVFLLVKLAYDNGLSLSVIFQFIACCTVFLWFRTLFLMPRMHIPFPLPNEKFQYGLQDCKASNVGLVEVDLPLKETKDTDEDVEDIHIETKENANLSFWVCVKTLKFWMNFMHLSLLQLRNYFFLGTFISWLKTMLPENSSDLGTYVNVFGVCQFFGVITAPLNGFLMDGAIRWLRRSCNDFTVVSSRAVALSAFATTSVGVLFSLTVAIPSVELQYLSFVLQVISRSFLYGGNASFIALLYPGKHFGKLYGLTMTLGGVVGLFQFPLFSLVLWVFEEDFFVINVIFIFVCLVTYAHPITLYMNSKKLENQTEKKTEDPEKIMLSNDEL